MATILVLDDDAAIRKMLRGALEMEEHRVCEAADAYQAAKIAAHVTFDLAICDRDAEARGVELPRLDRLGRCSPCAGAVARGLGLACCNRQCVPAADPAVLTG
jgi:CheY-like chemotaxis protein